MNLIKSTGTFSLFVILSRILGYIRDFFIAIYLGSGPIADAFFVAFRIPNTFRRLFAEGTFNAAFVPSYTSELLSSKQKAQKFANSVFNLLILVLFSLTILVEIFMPSFIKLIAPGFSEINDKYKLAIDLTRITFPFLFFISIASFFSAILNSQNKFAAAAAAPLFLNIILIICFFIIKNDTDLVYYLSYSITFAGIVQLIFLIFFTRKYFYPKFNFSFQIDKKIKIFFNKLLPSIFSSGVTQINILVGTIIASFQASAVSYLYYADRIYQINLAIAGIAIGTIILPNLSRYVKSKDKLRLENLQNKSLELSLFLSLPATLALLIASDEIVSALFGYGSFNEESVKNSALALFYFSLGLPAFSMIKIFSSFIFARNDTKTPFYFSLISVITNIVISVSLFSEVGFIIIPIATTISSWLNGFLLMIFVLNKNYFSFKNSFFVQLFKILVTNFVCLGLFKLFINYFNEYFIFSNSYKFLAIIILVIFIFAFYLLFSILIKAFKISDIKLKY
tara:strand:+ start:389 stop:1915 length:1527 start_codon:yes stop_codon:yes gene_type:complete